VQTDWEHTGQKKYQLKLTKDLIPGFEPKDKNNKPITADSDEYVTAYRKALGNYSKSIDIEAIGVFDTVGALGIPIHPWLWRTFPFIPTFLRSNYRFYDTSIGDHVKHAYHALALDEQRAAFAPTVWEREQNGVTKLEQVWFSGVHSNIGGGYAEAMVSNMSLAWMMQKLRDIVHFDEGYLKKLVDENREFYARRPRAPDSEASYKLGDAVWRWGLGLLYNSNALPTSLAGKLVRTPFQYKKTDYNTGRPLAISDNNLHNTNEKIHPSVRARYGYGGKDYSGAAYKSEALKDWKLDGNVWTYTGSVKGNDAPTSTTLVESDMAGFEYDLLDYDPQMRKDLGFLV